MINLGALYTQIKADTSPLIKAQANIKKFAGTSVKLFGLVSASVVALKANMLLMSAAALKMVSSVAKQTKELSYLAQQAGVSVGDLQAMAYATDSVGISAAKLSDISKDVFDKLGDYIQTGGGEFKDFFENVAPKVGLTAEALKKMSGPEALGAVKNALDKANVSAKEQVFFMEAIANDASRLIPLLANNGAKLKEMSDRARELGLSLSKIEVKQLMDASKATKELGATFDALKQRVSAALAPIYTAIAKYLTNAMLDFNKTVSTSDITRWAKESAISVLEFTSDFVRGFDMVYRFIQNVFIQNVIGILNLAFAGAVKLGQGFQWLFEQANRLTGNKEKAEMWAKAQAESAKIVQGAIEGAAEAFQKGEKGVEWTQKATKRINELKNQINKIDENVIEKGIKKPLEDISKNTLDELYKNNEGVWVNGGKAANKALGETKMTLEEINKIIDSSYNKMVKLSNVPPPKLPAQGRMWGGLIQKLKAGGAIMAQAGRYFPGFGGGDKIPIMGEAGEYMLNKFSVRNAGVDTARAFNRQDWKTVVSNLSKKMNITPANYSFSMPAMAAMGAGQGSTDVVNQTVRNYYIPGDAEPIAVNTTDRDAARLLNALKSRYNRRS